MRRDRGGMNSDWRGHLYGFKLQHEAQSELESKIGNLQSSVMFLASLVGEALKRLDGERKSNKRIKPCGKKKAGSRGCSSS